MRGQRRPPKLKREKKKKYLVDTEEWSLVSQPVGVGVSVFFLASFLFLSLILISFVFSPFPFSSYFLASFPYPVKDYYVAA